MISIANLFTEYYFYIDTQNKIKVEHTKIILHRIQDALAIYSTRHPPPDTATGLEPIRFLLVNKELPTDGWDHPLIYQSPADNLPYKLISLGRDGQPGGTSFDADLCSCSLP